MNYGETVRTIYEQSSSATADTSSTGAARARRLCAGLVVAGALFGSAAPARADDGLAVGGLDGGSIEATVAAVQAAAVSQASAIVNEAATQAAAAPQAAPAPPPSTSQTGSGSGVAGGISAGSPAAAQSDAQPAAVAHSAAPAAAQTASEPAVVAPAAAVVSQPEDSSSSPAHAQATAVPSAAFDKLAREYQQNPARYHSLNSLPISRETVPASTLESNVKRAPFTVGTSESKPSSNPPPNCQQDSPGSSSQTGCDEPRPQPSHPHVGAVANGAPASPTAATQPDAAPSPGAPADRIDRVTAVGTPTQPLALRGTTAKDVPSRLAKPSVAPHAVATESVKAPGRRASAPPRAGRESAPLHIDRPRARAAVRSEAPQRESARAGAPSESAWPWLGLALLLFGVTSIGLAFASVGAGGAAAVGGLAARFRAATISAAAIGTRVRSKGLSARANGASGDRPGARGGIRYRD
jgi:hypothetical protein